MSAASRGRDLETRLRDEATKQGFMVDIARAVRTRLPSGGWTSSAFDFFGLFDLALLGPGLHPAYIQVTSDPSDASKHRTAITRAFAKGFPLGVVMAVAMWGRDERKWRLWMRASLTWLLVAPWFTTEALIALIKDQALPRGVAYELPVPKRLPVGPPPPTRIFIAERARKKARAKG
jgi:hypothetical protein